MAMPVVVMLDSNMASRIRIPYLTLSEGKTSDDALGSQTQSGRIDSTPSQVNTRQDVVVSSCSIPISHAPYPIPIPGR